MRQKLKKTIKTQKKNKINHQDYLSVEDIIDQYLLFDLFPKEKKE